MSDRKADISPEHFSWLVEGRSANQRSTLDLYRLINGSEAQLNRNAEYYDAAKELTGVAFSLWRAVFLSDTTEEFKDRYADLNKFLVSLISDNTVLYITDKNARNWSFHYYLDNAYIRLRKLSEIDNPLILKSELEEPADSDKDEWVAAQNLLEKALLRLSDAIRGSGKLPTP